MRSHLSVLLVVISLCTIVVLCVAVAACGGASRPVEKSSTSTADAAITVPPSMSVTGDYDSDDDPGEKHRRDDGDNDDIIGSKDRDNDTDSNGKSYFDRDDDSVLRFGHAADAADTKAIVRLVKRYFAAATAKDGEKACSMLTGAFVRSVPETVGGVSGPPYARGKSCAEVLSGIFVHYHRQLAAHNPSLKVAVVRLAGREGLVALAFRRLPGRSMRVERVNGTWRIDSLLDVELP